MRDYTLIARNYIGDSAFSLADLPIQEKQTSNSKALYLEAARQANEEFVQPNWGRVHKWDVTSLFDLPGIRTYVHKKKSKVLKTTNVRSPTSKRRPPFRLAAKKKPARMQKVRLRTERFEGFVQKIEGDVAYVTLRSDGGESLCGAYPRRELAAKNIGERDRFCLTLTGSGESVSFKLRLIPRRKVSGERQRAIKLEIEQALRGDTFDDDY
jgi:hypothetical protein